MRPLIAVGMALFSLLTACVGPEAQSRVATEPAGTLDAHGFSSREHDYAVTVGPDSAFLTPDWRIASEAEGVAQRGGYYWRVDLDGDGSVDCTEDLPAHDLRWVRGGTSIWVRALPVPPSYDDLDQQELAEALGSSLRGATLDSLSPGSPGKSATNTALTALRPAALGGWIAFVADYEATLPSGPRQVQLVVAQPPFVHGLPCGRNRVATPVLLVAGLTHPPAEQALARESFLTLVNRIAIRGVRGLFVEQPSLRAKTKSGGGAKNAKATATPDPRIRDRTDKKSTKVGKRKGF